MEKLPNARVEIAQIQPLLTGYLNKLRHLQTAVSDVQPSLAETDFGRG